jgi:hypothetical protein
MAILTLEDVRARLQPLLQTGETLQHWAFGQTKPKPSRGLLLLFPVVVVLGIGVAVFGARAAIALGLIEPGPMMPVVGAPLTFLVLGPYMYLWLKGILRCAVGLTDKRVLIADMAEGPDSRSRAEVSLADSTSVTGRAGFLPQLTVRSSDGVLKFAFPLNVRGNKEQAVAIVQRVAGR